MKLVKTLQLFSYLPFQGGISFVDFFLFYVCCCHIVLSVSCSLVVICWERSDFLALLYVNLLCICPASGVVLDCIDS